MRIKIRIKAGWIIGPAILAAALYGPAALAQTQGEEPGAARGLTQGSLTAYELPAINIYGVADQSPATPVTTRFGTQFNVVTEEMIARQGSLDFYDALRNVPGVTFQKKNIIGGQTSHSLYMRGRGAGHPSPDLNIFFDDVPRSGVLYGQALADGIPVYALGGMEIYKYPQPSRFGTGYGLINFIPKYMVNEGFEAKFGFEAGSYGTLAQNMGLGFKTGPFDLYAAQSFITTDGHVDHSDARQESYYLNTGFQLSEHFSLRLMTNYVEAKTEAPNNPLTGLRPDRGGFETQTSLTTLTLANEFDRASGYLKAYYNNTNFWLIDELNGLRTQLSSSKQSNDLYGLRGRETFSPWTGGEIVAGFDLDRADLVSRQQNWTTGAVTTWDFPNLTTFSPYLALSQFFGAEDAFHIIPSAGLRYYHHTLFNDKTAPQAGLIVGYGGTDLNFNYAKGVNYPSPVILQAAIPNQALPSAIDLGAIKPETVDHYEIGLSHTWPELARLAATWFTDRGRDRTRAYMGGPQPPASFNYTIGEYKINGVELSGSLTPLENLELFAGATWLKVRASGQDGLTRDQMPYTPDFTLQTGFSWKFLEHFRLSGDYQHLEGVYQGTAARTGANFAELTELDRLDDVDVVNLRLDYLFDYEPLRLKESKVFLAVNNVFGSKYAYAMETDRATGRKAPYEMPGTTFMIGTELNF